MATEVLGRVEAIHGATVNFVCQLAGLRDAPVAGKALFLGVSKTGFPELVSI